MLNFFLEVQSNDKVEVTKGHGKTTRYLWSIFGQLVFLSTHNSIVLICKMSLFQNLKRNDFYFSRHNACCNLYVEHFKLNVKILRYKFVNNHSV